MKEKGFTLIELLGVITILAILGILILPQIISQLKKQEPQIDETTKKLVIAATENFVERNPNDYPMDMGNRFCITLAQLVSDGIMEVPIKTANGTEISLDTVVEVNVLRNDELDITYDSPSCQAIQPRLLYGIMRDQASDVVPDYRIQTVYGVSGVFKTTEKGEEVYFYRGLLSKPEVSDTSIVNNHLKLDNTCWLIVRTTATHGIKLLYNGTPNSNGACLSTSQLLETSANYGEYDPKETPNLFYIYEDENGAHDSAIKVVVDNWYNGNALSANDKAHLEMTDFCVDRTYRDKLHPVALYPDAVLYERYYGSYDRVSAGTPNLNCPNAADIYSLKVGLLTADEINFSGLAISDISSNGVLQSSDYWTLSPGYVDFYNIYKEESTLIAKRNFRHILAKRYLDTSGSQYDYGVRPVISLKPGIMVFGEGTYENPYTIAH